MNKHILWAKDVFSHYHEKILEIQTFRQVPWSVVYRILTLKGIYFLKATHPLYPDEWKILKYFNQHHYLHVPKMLAYHPEYNSILLHDAGPNFHDFLHGQYMHKLILKVIKNYASIQLKSSQDITNLYKIMSMSCQLKDLPLSLQMLLEEDQEILIKDGLELTDLSTLKHLINKIEQVCFWIDDFKIPLAIEHGDLFDENFNLKKGHITITDWADAGVGHPFFSFGFLFNRLAENYTISLPQYIDLKNRYLSYWRDYASRPQLNQVLLIMNSLSRLRTIFSYSRIAKLNKNKEMDFYKGYLCKNFLAFIDEFQVLSDRYLKSI